MKGDQIMSIEIIYINEQQKYKLLLNVNGNLSVVGLFHTQTEALAEIRIRFGWEDMTDEDMFWGVYDY